MQKKLLAIGLQVAFRAIEVYRIEAPDGGLPVKLSIDTAEGEVMKRQVT